MPNDLQFIKPTPKFLRKFKAVDESTIETKNKSLLRDDDLSPDMEQQRVENEALELYASKNTVFVQLPAKAKKDANLHVRKKRRTKSNGGPLEPRKSRKKISNSSLLSFNTDEFE